MEVIDTIMPASHDEVILNPIIPGGLGALYFDGENPKRFAPLDNSFYDGVYFLDGIDIKIAHESQPSIGSIGMDLHFVLFNIDIPVPDGLSIASIAIGLVAMISARRNQKRI